MTSRSWAIVLAALVMLPTFAPTRPGPAVAAESAVGELPDGPARVSVQAIGLAVGAGAGDLGLPDDVGWALLVENAGDRAWGSIEIVAELHGALGSRSALRAALGGGVVPPMIGRTRVPAGSTPLPPGGLVRVEGPLPSVGVPLPGPTNAVHPLRLRVVADGTVVGRIDTAIVRLGTSPPTTLATSLVWPLSAPPLRDPAGAVGMLDPLTHPGARLDTLVTALGADGLRGVALVPALHLIEDLVLRSSDVADPADDPDALRAAELLERIRAATLALPTGPIVAPYGDADLTRLLASDAALHPLAARAVLEGTRRVEGLLGRSPAPVVLLEAPVAPGVLDLLPGSTILLPHAAIDAPDLALDVPVGEPVRSLRSPTGRTFTVVVGDPYLTAALGASTRTSPGDPVLAAHELLVRTAMIHLEAPGREGRGLLLLPPPGFDPDPRFAAALLAGFDAAPWLTPTSPAALVAATLGERTPVTLAEGPAVVLPSRLADALRRAERDIELLAGATDGLPDQLDLRMGPRDLQAASDELMRATSRAFADDPDTAVALLGGVRAGVDAAFGDITIVADDVTLTARDGIVPVTIVHTGGVALSVRVELVGPAALTWTDGRVRELVLAPDASGSLEVPVRSGPTGRFPVTVRVTDPTGARLLANETLSVRATAVAGPALGLISALVVLLIIVGIVRQRRRGPSVSARRMDPRTMSR